MSVGCATLMGSPKQTNIDNPNQVEALSRAQVWQPTNVESMDVRQGPRDSGAFAPMATVNCRHVEKDATGKTPKFACVVGGDELKVKYGRDNGEMNRRTSETSGSAGQLLSIILLGSRRLPASPDCHSLSSRLHQPSHALQLFCVDPGALPLPRGNNVRIAAEIRLL